MNVALRPRDVTFISLCTGGGGLDLAVELAMPGARGVCLVEREAFAVARLVEAMQQGLMAPAPVWSDVRTLDGRRWRGLVDGVIGGIPCQPHSLAGKRLGRDDPRDLWGPARRIIVQSGAWWVLIENVGGMLSSGGADRVRRDLLRLGFRVEGGLFTASEIGASHERERLFILGVADAYSERSQGVRSNADASGWPDARRSAGLRDRATLVDAASIGWGEGRTEPEFRRGRDAASGDGIAMDDATLARGRAISVQPGRQGEACGDIDRPGLFPPGPGDVDGWRDVISRAPKLEPAVRRMADGMASRVDELRMLGNGVVPLEGAYALRTLATRLAAAGSDGAAELVRRMTA